jgi:hypothetical protein
MRKMVNSKLKKIGLGGAIFVTLTMILVSSYLVYQDVKPVHDYFSPMATADLNIGQETDEWSSIKFNGQDSVKFDSVFWDKVVVNGANSDGNVLLRVKDTLKSKLLQKDNSRLTQSKKMGLRFFLGPIFILFEYNTCSSENCLHE